MTDRTLNRLATAPFLSKIGFTAVAVLLIIAGCKKDDDKPPVSFSVTGDTSLHFEAGDTQRTAYTGKNLTKFTYETPEGWTCGAAKGVITITAPDSGGDESGTVTITATTVNSTKLTARIQVAIVEAEELDSEPANCYIVAEPGKRFRFDATIKGNDPSATLSPDDAVLLWSAPDGAVSHVSIDKDGYLNFFTKDGSSLTSGNALVAVRDANDNVLWSWHIWVTDYDPGEDSDLINSHGDRVISRNLGATAESSDTSSTNDILRSYGLYYQWGRKDPFPGPVAWNSASQLDLYNSKSKAVFMSFATSSAKNGTLAYATAHPTTFIAGVKESGYDWLWESDDDLWGDGGEKSVNDPCPAGWRVVPADSFYMDWDLASGDYGCRINPPSLSFAETFYPGAGRRSFSNTMATGVKNYTNIIRPAGIDESIPDKQLSVGFYWSSTPDVEGRSKCFVFYRGVDNSAYFNRGEATYGELNPETGAWSPEGARAGGFPLRCIHE